MNKVLSKLGMGIVDYILAALILTGGLLAIGVGFIVGLLIALSVWFIRIGIIALAVYLLYLAAVLFGIL